MDSEKKVSGLPNELECLFTKEPTILSKTTSSVLEVKNFKDESDSSTALIKDGLNRKSDPLDLVTAHDNIEIKIWTNKKILIRKPLIPLRLAQFFWFGSGRLNSQFFSLMLKHKGLTLAEFSWVFSMICLFQFAVGYISGLIVDKIGNAKPVLIFHILATLTVFICILIAPNVNENCVLNDAVVLCSDDLENRTNMDYCNYACLKNDSIFINKNFDYEYGGNSSLKNFTTLAYYSQNDHEFSIAFNKTDNLCNKTCLCTKHSPFICSSFVRVGLKIYYGIMTLLFFLFWSTAYRILDIISLNLVDRNDSDFGYERSFALSGEIVASTLANFILNVDKSGEEYYDSVYWIAVAFKLLAAVAVYNIKSVINPPGQNLVKKSFTLLKNTEVMFFLTVLFIAGNGFAFDQFYNFWFLDSLKTPKAVFGFYLMCFSIYGLPMYITSKWWLGKLGAEKIIILGLFGYSINQTSYSFLYYPWLSILIEFTIAFSYHLFWVSAVIHSRKLAPEGLAATLTAVSGTVHFGIGRSSSVSIGGLLISSFGIRKSYRIMAGVSLSTAILYSVFLYVRSSCLPKQSRLCREGRVEMKRKEKTDDQEV